MTRTHALRISILVSMGLVPAACGGTTRQRSDEDGTGGTGSNVSGGSASMVTAGSSLGGSAITGTSGAATAGSGAVGSGAAGSGAAGSGATTTSGGAPCTSPKIDELSGLVVCGEGYRHRPKAVDCTIVGGAAPADLGDAGGPNDLAPALPRATGSEPCRDDPSICKKYQYGYCQAPVAMAPAVCASGCLSDEDCGGGICVCDGRTDHGGTCFGSGDCKVDADCPTGSRCASTDGICGAGGFACQRATDSCVTSKDCAGRGCVQGLNGRECSSFICGRPFLIESSARVADTVSGDHWLGRGRSQPRLVHLSPSERAALAAHWTKLGQMEHASIAAFARFSLQLLALGAPPELVEDCTRALADETAHTKLCFGLASAYAGRAIGPGPLDVTNSLDVTTLSDIVDLVIAEGCFGETSAALEALEAAASASDPVIIAAYTQIAADEQRHAELAFRFVRWALERDAAAISPRVATAIATAPRADEVARPCLQALLSSLAA